MKEILVLNPTRKKRTSKKSTSKKGVKKMAAKRRRRRTTKRRTSPVRRYAKAPTRRRRRRRNPSPSRRRRAAAAVKRTIGGMNIKGALKNMPPTMIGMFAAKGAAKLWGQPASETDPTSWNWASYLKGAAGAFIAGFIGSAVKANWGQKILEGGMSLMTYKLIENELIVRSPWAMKWFGQDEDYYPSEYIQTDSQGTPYMLGQNGQWYPVDERHRLPEYQGVGDELSPPGRLGDELSPPGRLGDQWQDAYFGAQDPWAKGFFG